MANNNPLLKSLNKAFHYAMERLLNPFSFANWFFIAFLGFLSHLPIEPVILPDTVVPLFLVYGLKEFVFAKAIPLWFSGILVVFFALVFLIISWVRYIGKFMFFYAAFDRNNYGIENLWKKSYKQGTVCFLIFFGLLLVSLLITGTLLVILYPINQMLCHFFADGFIGNIIFIYTFAPVFCCLVLLAIVFMVLKDFLVPMLIYDIKIYDGIKILLELCRSHPAAMLGYLCIRTILWGGLMVMVGISAFLCMGITLLPFIKILIFLPIYVWLKLYPLFLLEEFGVVKVDNKRG